MWLLLVPPPRKHKEKRPLFPPSGHTHSTWGDGTGQGHPRTAGFGQQHGTAQDVRGALSKAGRDSLGAGSALWGGAGAPLSIISMAPFSPSRQLPIDHCPRPGPSNPSEDLSIFSSRIPVGPSSAAPGPCECAVKPSVAPACGLSTNNTRWC